MTMIDIGEKEITSREAVVEGKIYLKASIINDIKNNKIPKGNVLETAKVAGILAAKKTSEIIPLCHPIPLDYVQLNFKLESDHITVTSTIRGQTKTGVEMEGFVATATACITIYDMCKFADKEATISEIKLLRKTGGKTGDYLRK